MYVPENVKMFMYKHLIFYIFHILDMKNMFSFDEKLIASNEENCDVIMDAEYQKKAFDMACKYVKTFFPDYEDDMSFGGDKKFVKIIDKNNKYYAQFINPNIKKFLFDEDGSPLDDEIFYGKCPYSLFENNMDVIINHYLVEKNHRFFNYFETLIENGTIKIGTILNVNGYHKKILNKSKYNIHVENLQSIVPPQKQFNVYEYIAKILLFNFVVNGKFYFYSNKNHVDIDNKDIEIILSDVMNDDGTPFDTLNVDDVVNICDKYGDSHIFCFYKKNGKYYGINGSLDVFINNITKKL